MMDRKLSDAIRAAWRQLDRALESSSDGSRYLIDALCEEERSEREHRRVMRSMHKLSVSDTSMLLVLRTAINPPRKPRFWSDAAAARPSRLLAAAAGEELNKKSRSELRKVHAAVLALEYSDTVLKDSRS